MSRKRILIVGNMPRAGVREEIERLRPWLAERADIAAVIDGRGDGPLDESCRADLCVVFGGDGTLLAAARRIAGTGMAMIGVNMGKLGFLADFTVEHMQKHLDDILAGTIRPVERMMLDVDVGDGAFHSLAANDVAVVAGPPFRMIDLRVERNGTPMAAYFGDGVVVATPTGSTGYNLSLYGPIVEPSVEAMVITPVATHSLSMRPIVVTAETVLRIVPVRVNDGSMLVIDGQVTCPLANGQVIGIRRADCRARIVPHPGRDFFDTLTRKLQWGRSPHHP